MKNKETEVDQQEHDVQETNTNKEAEATPDPDMFRRVTRSGTALLASVSTSNSILKSVAFNKDYDMTVILSSSQHSLAALKAGINSQDRKPLTQTEKSILTIISFRLPKPYMTILMKYVISCVYLHIYCFKFTYDGS